MSRTKNTEISRAKLAAALGLSERHALRLAERGMPTDSVEAARAWRRDNIEPRAHRDRRDLIVETLEFAQSEGYAFYMAVQMLSPALRSAGCSRGAVAKVTKALAATYAAALREKGCSATDVADAVRLTFR